MLLDSLRAQPANVAALAYFLGLWAAYSVLASGRFTQRVTLTQAMNRERERWMATMARRDLRMIDTSIMTGLQQGTAFFASACILAIGGCLALVGASDQAIGVLDDLPFSTLPSRTEFEVKVLGLIVILAYSFFKFGWAYRLFNYCSILIGAVPILNEHDAAADKSVRRAARMNVLAGGHFNAGMRGIFFSIGYLGWFVGPTVFALSTTLVFIVLVRRQFYSEARTAVADD